jgi:hypothetical protein
VCRFKCMCLCVCVSLNGVEGVHESLVIRPTLIGSERLATVFAAWAGHFKSQIGLYYAGCT